MKDPKELKILLAEDSKLNQQIAVLTFRQMGISIDIASNGLEAFDKYQQNYYDLILMDMQMPVMDGLEATRQIRAFENDSNTTHRVYIVALTANQISEIKQECILAGMDDFMEKPFQEAMLRVLFSKSI
jgi:two-component system, sensor histidine kinase